MFAFGFYDSHDKRLMLARDRFGIKPLYIYDKDDLLIFSSEVKAILDYVKIEPDSFSISSFLYGFGGPTKNHTFFKDLKFVAPGSVINIKAGKSPVHTKFFDLTDFWDGNEAENLRKLPLKTIVDETENYSTVLSST
jgi:asparagine synthase (glutamine-hydrolysing)